MSLVCSPVVSIECPVSRYEIVGQKKEPHLAAPFLYVFAKIDYLFGCGVTRR
jgi:hypothetical protein